MSEEAQKSEFNMAVSYLARLNSLFYVCDDAAMNLDMHQWFHASMALYRELCNEIKKEEAAEIEAHIKKINSQLHAQNKSSKAFPEIPEELYMALHEFEIKLRMVCQRAGLQNKMIEDARKALR